MSRPITLDDVTAVLEEGVELGFILEVVGAKDGEPKYMLTPAGVEWYLKEKESREKSH